MKQAQELSSKEMDEWFSANEALEAKKIELDIESHFINEARQAVNVSIEHSIEDCRKEQEILHKQRDVLTDELQKLLALVKDKEKEIAENDTKIKAVEERIADVVSGFEDSKSSIDIKYDNLQAKLSQMHLQSEALTTKRKEIDKFLAEGEGNGAKLRELAKVSEDEAKAYQEVVDLRKSLKLSILKSMEDKVRLAKTEEKLTEDVQILHQEVSALRASLQVDLLSRYFICILLVSYLFHESCRSGYHVDLFHFNYYCYIFVCQEYCYFEKWMPNFSPFETD